jgi:DNA-binding HxlR family transcriptional regulator
MKCEKKTKCSIENIVDIMGKKWNLVIVWHLRTGVQRFTELQRQLCDVNSKTVTKHLRDLERYGVVTRQVFPEVPPRVEYALTERGEALVPIIESMLEWGGRYLPVPEAQAGTVPPEPEPCRSI